MPNLSPASTPNVSTLPGQFGQIGRYQDEETGLQGVCRLALSAEDGAGRRLVVGWMKELGSGGARRPYRQRLRPPGRPPLRLEGHVGLAHRLGAHRRPL